MLGDGLRYHTAVTSLKGKVSFPNTRSQLVGVLITCACSGKFSVLNRLHLMPLPSKYLETNQSTVLSSLHVQSSSMFFLQRVSERGGVHRLVQKLDGLFLVVRIVDRKSVVEGKRGDLGGRR